MSSSLETGKKTASDANQAERRSGRIEPAVPKLSRFMLRGFNWYVPRYLRRHFNAVRVAKPARLDLPYGSVVCFANHPSWWDPLMAFFLNRIFLSGRTVYAPIDQQSLKQYPVFGKLGFYGIDLESLEGAKRFLSVTRTLLQQPTTAIWMTPSGKMIDVRRRSELQPGIAHIAADIPDVTFLPVALEYPFWEERTPEALVEFGEPMRSRPGVKSKREWQVELEHGLATAQAKLAERASSRQRDQFDIVLDGSAGVGGCYDLSRRFQAIITGQQFNPRHSRPSGEQHAID